MKNLILTLTCILCITIQAQDITPYAEQINLEQVKEHVYTLASPEMMGRNTGEQGQKDAAKYIADYYRTNGLDSLSLNQYQQNFDLYEFNNGEIELSHTYYLEEQDSTIERKIDCSSIATSDMNLESTVKTRYLGYGEVPISEDLSDVAVLMITNESLKDIYKNIHRLKKENNACIFFISSENSTNFFLPPTLDQLQHDEGVGKAERAIATSKGIHLAHNANVREELLNEIHSALPSGVIVNHLSKWEFSRVMGEEVKDLCKAENRRLKGKEYEHYAPKTDSIHCNAHTHSPIKDEIHTENIIAYVEGTDLKHEVIVISGHYDHIGAENDTTINYGADDNASGSAGVMETAKAFQQAANDGIRPRRSILFINFSGEEIGLRGSDYFVDNCPIDLDSVVLNINMDMIGRNAHNDEENKNTVYVITKGKHDGFTKRTAKRIGKGNDSLLVSTHPGFSEKMTWSISSDHFRFSRKNIPIACFFTGLHPDYHTPRDTPDKINYEKLTEICKLCTLTTWEIANSDKNLLSKRKYKDPNLIEKVMD